MRPSTPNVSSAGCWLIWECALERGAIVITLVNRLGQFISIPLDEFRPGAYETTPHDVRTAAYPPAEGSSRTCNTPCRR